MMQDASSVGEGRFATQSAQLFPPTARGYARAVALSSLASWMALDGSLNRGLARPRVHFLNLHHLLEDELSRFDALVRRLARTHRFVAYGEGVRMIAEDRIDGPTIAVSFDDGLTTAALAAPILEAVGGRACFFVCPTMVGVRDYERIRAFCETRLRCPPMGFLEWDELERLQAAGHEIGGHTMGHVDLASVPTAQAVDEIMECHAEISRRLGPPHHFAWPYGRFFHFAPPLVKTVSDAGFTSCASAERGSHVAPASESMCIRRDDVKAWWPLSHVTCLLARSALRATPATNEWPVEWRRHIPSTVT